MEQKVKIIVTGGHLSPMVACIDAMQTLYPSWNIVCIGRRFALEKDKTESAEFKEMTNRSIRFLPLVTGRLSRDISFQSLVSLCKVPIGVIQAFLYVLVERPTCICSFGGYIGLPVVLAGWLLGVRAITHEQTHTLGLANRLMRPLVDTVFLTYDNTRFVKGVNHVVSGLPIRHNIVHPPKSLSFTIPSSRPIIYITGGTTGATSLNDIVFSILQNLLEHVTIIHQTGPRSIDKAKEVKQSLPSAMRKYYIPMSYISSADVGWIMHHMELLIGRSGANTVAEVKFVGKKAIFVPLPWSRQQEQYENAQWYKKTGNGMIFDQVKDSKNHLVQLIKHQLNTKTIHSASQEPLDAATTIVTYINRLIQAT